MPHRLLRFGALALVGLSLGACGSMPGATLDPSTRLSERDCLARAMYFESNRSSPDGMAAVGTVVMNRLQSGRYPKTVCGVVGQKNQFAEGALTKPVGTRSWPLAQRVADEVLAGRRHAEVGAAMHFHTVGWSFPYRNMRYVTLAGGNIFYDKRYPLPGTPAWPSATAFASRFKAGAPATMLAEAAPARTTEPVRLAFAESAREAAPEPSAPRLRRPEPAERPIVLAAARPRPARIARPTDAPATPVTLAARASEPAKHPPAPAAHPVLAVRSATPPVRAAAAPPTRPIVLAMLDRKPARPAARPRSIADLIAMDD